MLLIDVCCAAMTVAGNASLVECRIGGTAVPLTRSPRCRTCRSESRRDVEVALAEGRSYSEIAALFPESGLSKRHLSEHFRRHFPVDSPQVKRVVAEQAADNGEIMQVAVAAQVEALKFARSVVRRVAERLASGEVEPTVKEAVAMARLLAEYDEAVVERDELRAETGRAHDGMFALLQLVQSIVSAEDWSALGRAIDLNPDLRVFLAGTGR